LISYVETVRRVLSPNWSHLSESLCIITARVQDPDPVGSVIIWPRGFGTLSVIGWFPGSGSDIITMDPISNFELKHENSYSIHHIEPNIYKIIRIYGQKMTNFAKL